VITINIFSKMQKNQKWTTEMEMLLLDRIKQGATIDWCAEYFECSTRTIKRRIIIAIQTKIQLIEEFEKLADKYAIKIGKSPVWTRQKAVAWSIYKYSKDSSLRYFEFISNY
jgi:hypothetical protein